jgi:hypothetical protein
MSKVTATCTKNTTKLLCYSFLSKKKLHNHVVQIEKLFQRLHIKFVLTLVNFYAYAEEYLINLCVTYRETVFFSHLFR